MDRLSIHKDLCMFDLWVLLLRVTSKADTLCKSPLPQPCYVDKLHHANKSLPMVSLMNGRVSVDCSGPSQYTRSTAWTAAGR